MRNNHITINLDDESYNKIIKLAESERRKVAEYVSLLVIDEIEKRIANDN